MSIRAALIGGISFLLVFSSAILAFVGIHEIRASVVREAQSRIARDLSLLRSLYDNELTLSAERLQAAVDRRLAGSEAIDWQSPSQRRELSRWLQETRIALGFTILGLAGPDGRRLWTEELSDGDDATILESDPVLRSALEGVPSHGTLRLTPERLRREGGEALASSLRIAAPPGKTDEGLTEALARWHAVPLFGTDGQVVAAIYGGRAINHDHQLIDRFGGILFGDRLHQGKPVGTVTVFLGDTRVATNVRDAAGRRALGTRVSDAVRDRVLVQEEHWQDRAWVVDSWYLSGYQPLQDPTGHTIGMLYVGLLEAPYDELRFRLIRRFAVPALALLALALIATVVVVGRITRPLEHLRDIAGRIAAEDWNQPVDSGGSYREITSLSDALVNMQSAIRQRDADLRGKNAELSETNDRLEQANENYMSTLGFVTHELKAPLANMQSYIDLVVDGFGGQLDDKGRSMLVRVRRNCEELQGMVKDYLDLSRAERGGLLADLHPIDLVADVIEPSAELVQGLFRSRDMRLELTAPEGLSLEADPELLRIALTNLLNNAAKYGREGGRATLEAQREGTEAIISVWNEGEGFSPAESADLFRKFSRLRNTNTRSKKGSGLGLFLTAQIVDQHGGTVSAEAEAGQWARFGFRLPLPPE